MEEEQRDDNRHPTWIPIAPSARRLYVRPIRPTVVAHHRPAGGRLAASTTSTEGGWSASYFTSSSSPLSSSPTYRRTFRPPPPEMFVKHYGMENGSKRRTTETATTAVETNIYRESRLVHLCRSHQWSAVIERCKSRPEEAVPYRVGLQDSNRFHAHSTKRVATTAPARRSNGDGWQFPTIDHEPPTCKSDHLELFHDTALGIACACDKINTEELHLVITSLLAACPSQVNASQLIHGHTPLRDAIRNRNCTPQLLSLLLASSDWTRPEQPAAPFMKDRDGLLPVDHIILGIQLGTPKQSIDLLKEFNGPLLLNLNGVSPLIRLLTLGTSFGIKQQQESNCAIDTSPWRRSYRVPDIEDSSRLSRVFESAKHMLAQSPLLVRKCSKATGCSPLHVALRNYGNFAPLVKELLKHDETNKMVQLRNHYGDLPLHVATSVGVPINVLRMILQRTVASVPYRDDGSPHPLVWSTNRSGYTPVDLEWVRHIESGKGFYSSRSFYPLDASGVRKHCRKQDKYYKELLEEAVCQVVNCGRARAANSQPVNGNDLLDLANIREEKAKGKFGMLIDRLELLVKAASSEKVLSRTNDKTAHFDSLPYILHSAAKLSQPNGPSLPLPILRLLVWLHQDQLNQPDDFKRLPLHHALIQSSPNTPYSKVNADAGIDWSLFVQSLLNESPSSAMATDKMGRLPLHAALDRPQNASLQLGIDTLKSDCNRVTARLSDVIERLVECFPNSVDSRDPQTHLFPFMQAATNPHISLDAVFRLLRRSPSRCRDATVAHRVASGCH